MRKILDDFNMPLDDDNPVYKVQKLSCQPLPKRFYKEVSIAHEEGGFSILLDGTPVKTPARRCLLMSTEALAALVAQEFTVQEESIDPGKMPITRLVNTVVDGIADNMQIIFEDLLRFVACDMIFYRAQTPKELVEQQCEQWDFLLDWVEEKLGARFNIAAGVMHIEQPWEAIQAVSNYLRKIESPYILAALHAMTTLTGSALIAFAVAEKKINLDNAWDIAHLDENWTKKQWGVDKEAMMRRAYKKSEFNAAAAIITACA
ncbi:ATP12 family chaperone protein [Bartonella schoenbuchensis]|uniref:ATP12 chaperone family protein n=1 Tax=Bartonella schoenbuchensis (strain DSM 13525 / NCTC 13165 / R1) TaxID=687861 RepID=E6YZV1_BARSR|nr:ATP12 family protein [Bartonella schoenbuchensis]AQX30853.1 Chaperone required for the assembly of the F1-ATPase [Bartonella schoenbuchensis R1]CBI82389.1 ATP12 chaperone family protein [Bartonella schoenbuchensis R1]